jgi:hypothetical protein
MTDRDPEPSRTLLSMQALRRGPLDILPAAFFVAGQAVAKPSRGCARSLLLSADGSRNPNLIGATAGAYLRDGQELSNAPA